MKNIQFYFDIIVIVCTFVKNFDDDVTMFLSKLPVASQG